MFDFEDVQRSDFPALDWALHLPGIRDGRGAIDHAAHRTLTYLARKGDWQTGLGCFPSVQNLADALDTDESFTRKKLGFLVELGLIRRMDIEEIAEYLEQRKADQGKAVMTTWCEMAQGTREYYEERFDPQRAGQTAYALNIADEDLWERMEKQKYERKETSRAKALDRHKRHNSKRYGTPPPEAPRMPQRVVQPTVTPKAVVVQEAPDAPVQAPVRDQMHGRPNFQRGIPRQLPEEPNLGERLIEYVMPKLNPAPQDARHARTVLMKFADRWPRCLEMAQLVVRTIKDMPGNDMEIGCFEEAHDPDFAIPLNAHIEKQAANPAA